ncbi:MAG: arginase [Flavobacteriales bacterium]|nr:arginase [Flavobacteriales bacterium]
MRNNNIIIIENPSELGAGTRGAATGPIAVRLADNQGENKIYGKIEHTTIKSRNEALCKPVTTPHAKYVADIYEHNQEVVKTIKKQLLDQKFPLIISGDHSNAIGSIAAIKDTFPNKRLGVIWIDAHADLHTPYTSPSGNMHGMPLGVSLGEGYQTTPVNIPQPETIDYWHKLTHLGENQIHPKLLPTDLVFISIRDLEEPEWEDIEDNHIKHFVPARLLNKSMSDVAAETLEYLNQCDHIYISFDVDSMDPSVSTGTGTSVENGLTLPEAKNLLQSLMQSPKIVSLEITEINPLIDHQNKMAQVTLDILSHLLQ